MTTTQDSSRTPGWAARCDSDCLVVLGARLARGGVGALWRLLMGMLLKRPVVAGLAIAGIGSRAQLRDRDARSLRARAIRRWRRCSLFAVVGTAASPSSGESLGDQGPSA